VKLGAPQLVWLLALIPALVVFLRWAAARRRRREESFAEPELYRRLSGELSPPRRLLRSLLAVASVAALVLGLLDPRWGYHWEDVRKRGIDLVVAVDTSRSMLADDIKPSRLARTRRELEDLIRMAGGDRIGLVAFAGRSFTLCPLTHDYGALRMFVNDISVRTVARGGTNLAGAIDRSLSLFDPKTESDKAILLITDGENLEGDWQAAAARARERGVRIFTIGIGSPQGTPIRVPTAGGEVYLKDPEGNIVISHLDEEVLKKIALETGGAYARATPTGEELELIYRERIASLRQGDIDSRRKKVYEHRYQLAALLSLLLLLGEGLLSEGRGGWLVGLVPRRRREDSR